MPMHSPEEPPTRQRLLEKRLGKKRLG